MISSPVTKRHSRPIVIDSILQYNTTDSHTAVSYFVSMMIYSDITDYIVTEFVMNVSNLEVIIYSRLPTYIVRLLYSDNITLIYCGYSDFFYIII